MTDSPSFSKIALLLLVFSIFSLFSCGPEPPEEVPEELLALAADADSLHLTAIEYHKKQDYHEAIAYFKKAQGTREAILEKLEGNDLPKFRKTVLEGIVKSCTNQGKDYFDLGDYSKAEQTLLACIERQDSFQNKWDFYIPKRRARDYHFLAFTYLSIKGLDDALLMLDQAAIHYQQDDSPGNRMSIAQLWIDYSYAYLRWEEVDSSFVYAQKAVAILDALGDKKEKAKVLNNLGIGYYEKDNTDQSLKLYRNALDINRVDSVTSITEIAKNYHNLGETYAKIGNFDLAFQCIDKAIQINEDYQHVFAGVTALSDNYAAKGDFFYQQKNWDSALEYYENAIQKHLAIYDGPIVKSIYDSLANIIFDNMGVFNALMGKAKTQAALGESEKALTTFTNTIGLINNIRRDYSDSGPKLQLAKVTKKIFEAAINTCLRMDNPRTVQAFNFAEQSKAFTLLEAVKHYKSLKIAGVDERLLAQEFELRGRIDEIDRNYLRADDSEKKSELLREKQALKEALKELIARLEKNDKYRRLMARMAPPGITRIQNELLEADQALVEYFVGDKSLFVFFVPKTGEVKVDSINIGRDSLSTLVTEMVLSIFGPHERAFRKDPNYVRFFKDGKAIYTKKAHELYQLLYNPLSVFQEDLPERLLIIPDEMLGYLPFDALLTAPVPEEKIGQYKKYPFLGTSKNISYCYSAAMLEEMMEEKQGSDDKIYAFALNEPEFEDQVQKIEKIFANESSGSSPLVVPLVNTSNPKASIEQKAEYFRYLHFSTHGRVNNQNPNYSYLLMIPEETKEADSLTYLYLYEIYNIPLNAEMVVTGACETGIGKLYRGEGIMSLARGFSIAGANSIVTTLWEVNQRGTHEILELFYKHLKDGQKKDYSLSSAKLDYIKGVEEEKKAAPYFWAGIIVIGNCSPLKESFL